MSKFVGLLPDHIPTEIPGLFIRNLSLPEVEELQKRNDEIAQNTELDQIDMAATQVLDLFQNILCGEDGTAFEDVTTIEDVKNKVGLFGIERVTSVVRDMLTMKGNE